ncbi:MAG: TerD family protein [Synergistaceae bacterium]|nr:TerD family protein [Synergistaceae bacterium]
MRGLSKILVNFFFDAREYDGENGCDIDLSAFLLGYDGRVSYDSDFVFYSNMLHPSEAVTLLGGFPYRPRYEECFELMTVDFSIVPANISSIVFTATIYDAEERHQNFGQVSNVHMRVVDPTSEHELFRYNLGDDLSKYMALIVGKLYRSADEWKFNAVGSGFKGGLAALCRNYGVNV